MLIETFFSEIQLLAAQTTVLSVTQVFKPASTTSTVQSKTTSKNSLPPTNSYVSASTALPFVSPLTTASSKSPSYSTTSPPQPATPPNPQKIRPTRKKTSTPN